MPQHPTRSLTGGVKVAKKKRMPATPPTPSAVNRLPPTPRTPKAPKRIKTGRR